MALTPLGDVQAHVLGRVEKLETVEAAPIDALGLAVAAPVAAGEPVPPFANSAMDGYAVRAADCDAATPDAPVTLKVVDELPAGKEPQMAVGAGEAIRIMTGAAIPESSDAIVIVEHTRSEGDEVAVIEPAGDHIRPAGGDVAAGEVVFDDGTEITPAHVGVLASLGLVGVPVCRRPRVGVLSTGDELVAPGEPLPPGKIRESNRPMLLALAERSACAPVDLGVAPDDPHAIEAALRKGADACDAVVTSGGVSMGAYDEVKVVLDRIGEMRWFQVAIKPAKPFAFGVVGGTPVFGLPGNPVSSFVSFELFARPALRKMMGQREWHRPRVKAVAAGDFTRHPDGKTHFDRVLVTPGEAGLLAERSGVQASNVLSAMARANGLAVLPDGDGVVAGDQLEVMLLDLPRTLGV